MTLFGVLSRGIVQSGFGLGLRHGIAFLSLCVGGSGVLGLLMLINDKAAALEKRPALSKQRIAVIPPKCKPPKRRKVKRRPRPRPRAQAPRAPVPQLSSSLTGMSFGLDIASDTGLEGQTDRLLGNDAAAANLVMNENSVDAPPRALHRVAPAYPARAHNITGQVRMKVWLGPQGNVLEVSVLSSKPPGVFDQVAMQAMRQWRFSPALYKGKPVAKYEFIQVMNFTLE
ncbi:MAG: energy transducer TonB [Myxococcota bacterium]